MKEIAVIGLGFGDEGKGLVTNWLSSPDAYVARYNGGSQAAHRVVEGDKQHIFSSVGSGTLKGARTIIGKNCAIKPESLISEITLLKTKGVIPIIFISPNTGIITPYDTVANGAEKFKLNGTCGIGFGTCKEREEDYNLKLTFKDISCPTVLINKLDIIAQHYEKHYGIKKEDLKELLGNFFHSIARITDLLGLNEITMDFSSFSKIIIDNPTSYLIYESAQGILLDKDYGIFPYVTRSNIIDPVLNNLDEYYLVTRAYSTRHGNGPFGIVDLEKFKGFLKDDVVESNKSNKYQGDFRTAPLMMDYLLNSLISFDTFLLRKETSKVNLVITCTDHLKEYILIDSGNTVMKFESLNGFLSMVLTIIFEFTSFTEETLNLYISDGPESKNIRQMDIKKLILS